MVKNRFCISDIGDRWSSTKSERMRFILLLKPLENLHSIIGSIEKNIWQKDESDEVLITANHLAWLGTSAHSTPYSVFKLYQQQHHRSFDSLVREMRLKKKKLVAHSLGVHTNHSLAVVGAAAVACVLACSSAFDVRTSQCSCYSLFLLFVSNSTSVCFIPSFLPFRFGLLLLLLRIFCLFFHSFVSSALSPSHSIRFRSHCLLLCRLFCS